MYKYTDKEIAETLKHWREIVSKYKVANTQKALIQLANTFLPYIGIWALMYFSFGRSILLTVLLGIINSFFLVRIFIIQHDCGHQSFLSSKKWNDIIGFVCSFFSLLPYKYWATIHNFHHGHSGQIEYHDVGDIPTLTVRQYYALSKWGKLKYRIWRNPIVTFIIAPAYYIGLSNRFPLVRNKMWKNHSFGQILNNISILGVYLMLGYLLGWKEFLFVQLFTIFLFGIVAFWFFYVQHQHEHSYKAWKKEWNFLVAAIKGSTYYKLPKLFQWLTGNIGIHHIHHLNSYIPNYNLEKCMKENPILNKYVTAITFFESLKLMSLKLWDEERKKMISFKEYQNLKPLLTQM